MRHRNSKAILNRPADHREAMVRNLLTSLFLHGKVKTTDARAKALASAAEKLITKVRGKDDMNAIREAMRVLTTKEASQKLIKYASEAKVTSGYTRNTRVGYRAGDNALLVMVELIHDNE